MSGWKQGAVKLATEELKEAVKGKTIALMMNTSALDNEARLLVDVMVEEQWADIKFFFGMEHGVRGNIYAGGGDSSDVDEKTGIQIVSLYDLPGWKPTAEWVAKVDAVVFCAQDTGVRHWTYTPWMLTLIDAAKEANREVIILDRPNPIRGDIVEGGFADEKFAFVDREFLLGFGYPLRHGMTIGEIALMYNDVKKVGANITVLKMEGWKRSMWFEETGLPWLPPSPNIPTVDSALYFAATGLMQGADFSLGIATTTPFQFIGDPSWDGEALQNELNSRNLEGVYFVQKYYQAMCYREAAHNGGSGKTALCDGVMMVIQDREAWKPVETQLHIMDAIAKLFPGKFELNYHKDLACYRMGTDEICDRASKGESLMPVLEKWRKDAEMFKEMRRDYLLYE